MTKEEMMDQIAELSNQLQEAEIEEEMKEQTKKLAKQIAITYRSMIESGIPEDLAKKLVVAIVEKAGDL